MTAPCVECGRPVSPGYQFFSRTTGPLHLVCFHAAHRGEQPRRALITPEDRMTITCLWLPGTGFSTGPDIISQTFGAALDERFEFKPLQYPAAYGTAEMPFAESVAIGKQILIDAIRATPNVAVIGGYSQGAGIAGTLAAEIGRGELPDLEVVGCALIADPGRLAGGGMPGSPVVDGYGIAGERPIAGVPTWWAAAEGDPITALPAGDLLRTVADVADYYSLAGPVEAFQWGEALVERAKAGRWQRWWSIENWRSWGGALQYAYNYLPAGGRHGRAYVVEGLCVKLAAAVNEAVR